MLIVATLPSTLILYLWAMLFWQWQIWPCLSETCLKWQRRSKVPQNARCVPSTRKVNVQRKFTDKLLLFMAKLWIGKIWRSGAVNSPGGGQVHDEQWNGRSSLTSDVLLQKIEELRANRRVTMRELHHIIPEVSKTAIHEAVTEKLGYRKLCARWVPKMLTDDQKTKRMGSAMKFLTRYAQEGDELLDSIVTEDETWGFTSLLNPSNSHCNGAIRIHPEPKNSKLQFQWKKPWRPFSGSEKVFSWSTSCLLRNN